MDSITVLAHTSEIVTVTEFVDRILERINCPVKAQLQIDVVIDEIIANIVSYAYDAEDGKITVDVEALPENVGISITFKDNGRQYNPLEKEDPDITLSAEERPIGGLGIFIVKKTMNTVDYSYIDGMNILTVTKNF